MIRLERSSLRKGQVLPIYVDEKFEGFGILIEQSSPPVSYMTDEDGGVYLRVRWLIEWAPIDNLSLTREQLWNQRNLQGRRTHRNFVYKVADDADDYIAKHGSKRIKYTKNDRSIDDTNILF